MYGLIGQAIALIGAAVLAFRGDWGIAAALFVISQVLYFLTKIAINRGVERATRRLDEDTIKEISFMASIGQPAELPPSILAIARRYGAAYVFTMVVITYMCLT